MTYNVLLVDDSSIVRKSIKKIFSMIDADVSNFFEAENGLKGLEILRTEWVDLVFLDINMPVMNGMEFMKVISEDEELKNTPIIVVSTEGSSERKQALLNYGVKDYLRKPVAPEDLAASIKKVIGKVHHAKTL